MSIMSEEDLEVRLERLEIHDGDVFLLHLPSGVSTERLRVIVEQIQSWLERHGRPDVLFVPDGGGADIQRVSADQMARAGWHRNP